VKSVICFGKVSIIGNEDERAKRLRQLGEKYFPDGYNIDAELINNGSRVAVLDLKIDHFTGKRVKEN
jgi:nitroimidazol reductase NimA-like FMN-containing flavoprotein (pyridoxamine 5'-phosphate oxidase superfamily)